MPVLTDAKIRATLPSPKPSRLFDEKGLYLIISPNGSRTWACKFFLDGRERRAGLGPYPDVSLKEAREKRDELRVKVRQGIDPIAEKRQLARVRKAAVYDTLEKVVRAWLERERERVGWTPAYYTDTVAAFGKHVFPVLGARPIADITAADLIDLIFMPMTIHGQSLEVARRLRQKLEKVWHFAEVRGLVTSNPVAPIKGELRRHQAEHFKAVPLDELAALLVGVRGYGNLYVEGCVWLQLLTGTRPGEARASQWGEFDLDAALWRIPAGRMKKRKMHVVPLSRQAVHLLQRLRQLSVLPDVLFPSRSKPGVPMSDATALRTFSRVGFPGITSHGMRSLFSTTANDEGAAPPYVVEAALAHVLGETKSKTEAAYNRATHLEARKGLMQWWADRVEAVCQSYTTEKKLGPLFPPMGPLA